MLLHGHFRVAVSTVDTVRKSMLKKIIARYLGERGGCQDQHYRDQLDFRSFLSALRAFSLSLH